MVQSLMVYTHGKHFRASKKCKLLEYSSLDTLDCSFLMAAAAKNEKVASDNVCKNKETKEQTPLSLPLTWLKNACGDLCRRNKCKE